MKEIWKPVVDFEQYYLVSNLGNVRRITKKGTRMLKPYLNRGYPMVCLHAEGHKHRKTVHQLVGAAFLKDFTYGDLINHIDGDKSNNHITNLEKTTYSLNNSHAFQNGLRTVKGKQSKYFGVSVLRSKQITKDGITCVKAYYRASIRIQGIRKIIKHTNDELEAAKAYDAFLDSIGNTTHKRNFS